MSEDYSLGKVEVALSPQERFDEYLQSRAMRNTKQRRQIVESVFSHHEHFDADTLIEQMSSKNNSGKVSRPTVYRTLRELVDAGLLRKFELEGRDVFEHDYGYPQHDHLYCKQCRRLFEFQSDELLKLRDAVAERHRFRVLGHRLIITGICENCRMVKRRVKRPLDLI
jgi:Fur family ferric uptake transcriptional regulator